MRHRVLPPAALAEHRALLASLLPALADLAAEECADREIVAAEKLVQRGENMLTHSKEIAARPKRTWFQSTEAKARAKAVRCRCPPDSSCGCCEATAVSSKAFSQWFTVAWCCCRPGLRQPRDSPNAMFCRTVRCGKSA